jgi:hypothetical protein
LPNIAIIVSSKKAADSRCQDKDEIGLAQRIAKFWAKAKGLPRLAAIGPCVILHIVLLRVDASADRRNGKNEYINK